MLTTVCSFNTLFLKTETIALNVHNLNANMDIRKVILAIHC